MYEQWPTDPTRPRALLNFEVLPDRVSVFLIRGVSQANRLRRLELENTVRTIWSLSFPSVQSS